MTKGGRTLTAAVAIARLTKNKLNFGCQDMNELQAEKLRDIVVKINEETGENPQIESTHDGTNSLLVRLVFCIPKEGNLK